MARDETECKMTTSNGDNFVCVTTASVPENNVIKTELQAQYETVTCFYFYFEETYRYIFILHHPTWPWDSAGSCNDYSRETMAGLSYILNTMAASVLGLQGVQVFGHSVWGSVG